MRRTFTALVLGGALLFAVPAMAQNTANDLVVEPYSDTPVSSYVHTASMQARPTYMHLTPDVSQRAFEVLSRSDDIYQGYNVAVPTEDNNRIIEQEPQPDNDLHMWQTAPDPDHR